jgi:hypothetical protein
LFDMNVPAVCAVNQVSLVHTSVLSDGYCSKISELLH